MKTRTMLNAAWWRATGGRHASTFPERGFKHFPWPAPENQAEWKRVDGDIRMILAARILEQQDGEPWKQRFDAWSDQLNAQAAKRKADWEWVQAHPIRAFFYLGWRRLFGR